MSNTIRIKRGENVPNNGVLQPYELGYVTSTGMLVIGQEDGSIKKFDYLPITGGTVSGSINASESINASTFSTNGTSTFGKITQGGSYVIKINQEDVGSWSRGFHIYNWSDDYMASMGFSGTKGTLEAPSTLKNFYVGENYSSDKHWLTLTPEGILSVTSVVVDSYGEIDPNIGNNGSPIAGVPGQLYFVITGD